MDYRRIRLGQLGNHPTVRFAVSEIVKYLKMMDAELVVDVLSADCVQNKFQNIIWVGQDNLFSEALPEVEDAREDDAIAICVKQNAGFITGSNARSVLLAAYRFLKALGCSWVRAGKAGERIPTKPIENVQVDISEAASYRHRGVCIEGSNTYENVLDMIDFLPKIGMNEYFVQFLVPYDFFARWYGHRNSVNNPKDAISRDEVIAMTKSLEHEIEERGLRYHKTGHGWTCEPFGMDGDGWSTDDVYDLSDEVKSYLAEVNGKRELWNNSPLCTNLCYSNQTVRDTMTDAITEYCKTNKNIDVLHFWLADASNNQCECPECIKKRPADWYLIMLNELDRKLTAANVDTKIVFLLYVDLMWAPVEEKLNNPDRFILMYAPISREYGENFSDHMVFDGELPPFVRNRLEFAIPLETNLEQLRQWQRGFSGDSFDFDYHLMWAHANDFGYEYCAKNLHEDMKALHKIGLNGMLSCQLQRCFFPSALPIMMMASTLWDENCDFEEKASEYYSTAFGEDGTLVHAYLNYLSYAIKTYKGRGYGNANTSFCDDFTAVKDRVVSFRQIIQKNISRGGAAAHDWQMLSVHNEYVTKALAVLEALTLGEKQKVKDLAQELFAFIKESEAACQNAWDVSILYNIWRLRIKSFDIDV